MDFPPNATDDEILSQLRTSDIRLREHVHHTLTLRRGDVNRMVELRRRATELSRVAARHRAVFSADEYALYLGAMTEIASNMNKAINEANEPPDEDLQIVRIVKRRCPGRPRKEITRDFLAQALEIGGPKKIAEQISCSSRTVRRRIIEHGLDEVREPVFSVVEGPDGGMVHLHQTATVAVSNCTDEELDRMIVSCRQTFPNVGQRNIQGYLRDRGHKVPLPRIAEAMERLQLRRREFMGRRIERRVYNVAGPNALWHHDGQHGLIKYGFVIHGFIDGYSRFVVGIRVHNNNRSQSVLNLFLDATRSHGIPSRVRGDHGTENLLVASWMEIHKGVERGSYIWGPSVHNTRIERLWFDVTQAFGHKWKLLFRDLEESYGLNTAIPQHKWLLCHLFLQDLNEEALEWQGMWNSHTMSLPGERNQSPREMFMFGMLREGSRGLQPLYENTEDDNDDVGDVRVYGIDWETLSADHDPMEHVEREYIEIDNDNGPSNAPRNLAMVPCEPIDCPLSDVQKMNLDAHLAERYPVRPKEMVLRADIWTFAVSFCKEISEIF